MNFSDNLIKLRKTKGWSQEDLADKLSLSRQAISKWEVGTSKPDIDNLINLSKLFKVSIDQLVNNEIIVTEAVSFDVKKNDKKKKVLTLLKRLFIVLAIIYVVNVIYNFAVLFTITQAELKYKELDNYHYIITTYDNEGLREKEECWFKDGVSKNINTIYSYQNIKIKETYIDFNQNIGYIINNDDKEKSFLNKNLIENIYKNQKSIYYKLPDILLDKNCISILLKSIKFNNIKINKGKSLIELYYNNKFLILRLNDFTPLSIHYEENDKFITKYFVIDLIYNEKINI